MSKTTVKFLIQLRVRVHLVLVGYIAGELNERSITSNEPRALASQIGIPFVNLKSVLAMKGNTRVLGSTHDLSPLNSITLLQNSHLQLEWDK